MSFLSYTCRRLQAHFRERKDAILAACDAYAAGTAAPGGDLDSCSTSSGPGPASITEESALPGVEEESAAPAAGTGSDGAEADAHATAPGVEGPASPIDGVAPVSGAEPESSTAASEGGPGLVTGLKLSAPSEGFKLLLQQLKPRLAAAIDSLG